MQTLDEMLIKEHKVNNEIYLLVDTFEHVTKNKVKLNVKNGNTIANIDGILLKLPPGEYEAVGCAEDLFEEQCKPLVEKVTLDGNGKACYRNYDKSVCSFDIFYRARQSLTSLCSLYDIETYSTFIFRKIK